MQKISRIHVSNYGPQIAWFDGITFDFNDPETKEPCDAVINLENGGGKTTLLGFIFSCFETRQERFLKHIQDRNHRFAEYFSKDGLPGVIVMEWLMPPKFSGGKPYRLVIGQAVAVRSAAEREEVERQFFAFEATTKLGFDSVPAPNLGAGEPARSMAEFQRWLHTAVKISSDFYQTRTQEDWQKHLIARSLDLDMLRLQVDFSAQEGGIDASFLTFHNDADFLKKFFALTLDAERAAAVRQVVVGACDKLRKKPELERRMRELTRLLGVMTPFADAAGHHEAARQARASLDSTAAAVRAALLAKAVTDEAAAKAHAKVAEAQEADAVSSANRAKDCAARGLTLRLLQLQRACVDAEEARQKLERETADAELELKLVEGAGALVRLEEARTRVAEMETLEEAEREGLKPARMQAEVQGALLRFSLQNEERRLSEHAMAAEIREEEAGTRLAGFKEALQKLGHREATLNRDHGALESDERRYMTRRERLVNDGLLLNIDVSSHAAIARLGQTLAGVRAAHTQALADESGYAEKERAHRERSQAAAREADTYRRETEVQEAFVAKGEAERERLSQSTVLRVAVEAEIADPDSPALLAALERLLSSDEAGIAAANVRLAELDSNRKAIEATGVAGRSRDVDEVVTKLLSAGVRSARAFNTYLADALQDRQRSRRLVLADPARFLGVSVATADIRRAKEVLAQAKLRLARPVVVSESALESSDIHKEHLVIGPADDAAYNRESASVYAGRLDADIAEANSELRAYRARRDEAQAAREQLRLYAETYGRVRLDQARAQIERLTSEAEAAAGHSALATEAAQTAAAEAQSAKLRATELDRKGIDLENGNRRLQEFHLEDEAPRLARVERLAEISGELQGIETKRSALGLEITQAESQQKSGYEDKVRFNSAARTHANERNEIALYDAKYPAEQALADRPMTIDVLRRIYNDAKSTFEAAERDRLGVLAEKLRGVREAREVAQKEFSKFASLDPNEVTKRKGLDLDARIAAQQQAIDLVKRAYVDARSNDAVAGAALRSFGEQNRQVVPPSPDMEILKDSELPLRIAQVEREGERASTKAEAAGVAAREAREMRGRLEAGAKLANQYATTLSKALEIPDHIGETAPTMLEADIPAQVDALISKARERTRHLEEARRKAHNAFNALSRAATMRDLQEVEPELSAQLSANDFDAACADRTRLSDGLSERIATTAESLSHMQEDFESCVVELNVLSAAGIQVLTSATTGKRVPQGAPYVGGKPVLKMRANFSHVQTEVRREALRRYLDNLIDTGVVPAKGADLVAECVLRMHGKPLGLQVLKMVPDEDQQYVSLDQLKNSGGEGVTMAMFLYLVINQLRAETHAKLKKAGGGPLILDNPFAKATTPTLWRAQRLLAEAMDVQLVFATALPDYNTIGEFRRFIRLRKAGKNQRTGRWHLEHANLTLTEAAEQFN